MADYDSVSIRAAHVPASEGEGIDDPVRSLAKVQLSFTGLRGPSGRPFDGVLTLYLRDDGHVLGKAHDHPVMLKAIYTDRIDDEPVTDNTELQALNDAGKEALQQHNLADIWRDSRMYALYQEAYLASRAAQKAVADFNLKQTRYTDHVERYYTGGDDGEVDAKDPDVTYMLLDADGDEESPAV